MQESIPFLVLNGGIGLAVIWLVNKVFNYLKDKEDKQAKKDVAQAESEKTQTETYKSIINGLAEGNAELRASLERREATYQVHNEKMAAAFARLDDTQASQISVLKDIHQSNEKLIAGAQQTNDNVLHVQTAVDKMMTQLEESVGALKTALFSHDDNAKERNELLMKSMSSSNELMQTFKESMVRMEMMMHQLRDLVKLPAIVSEPNEQSYSPTAGETPEIQRDVGGTDHVN